MHPFTGCCTHEGAKEGITPYQRLQRSSSTRINTEKVPNPSRHPCIPSVYRDLEPSMLISHSSAIARPKNFELRSASARTDLHRPTDSSRLCLHGQPETTLSIVGAPSQQLHGKSVPPCVCSAEIPVNVLNTYGVERCTNAIKLNCEDANTVVVKIGIVGDARTGKTSFMATYGGVEPQTNMEGVSSLQKLCKLQNVKIALHIWDLGGQRQYSTKMSSVCKDAATIFIMFDLTHRSTLQSVPKWYLSSRELNKVAMIILIGTKYDGFVQLSKELQFAIVEEATNCAKQMRASLFFSSVAYNINVHKVFKVAVAKLFDLPCKVTQNKTFGEPIVSF